MTTETEALRVEIAGLSKHKQTRRYSPQLQERVTAWAVGMRAEGASVPTMCLAIGIGEPTLRKLLGQENGGRAMGKTAGFRRVRLVKPTARAVVVRGPCGVAIEGLSLERIAELLKRLACSD
jgi:hypothetical protein